MKVDQGLRPLNRRESGGGFGYAVFFHHRLAVFA